MAKHSSHILEMARKGAEHKYEELKAEIGALVKHFPHLRGSHAKQPYPFALEQADLPAAAPRKPRRKMSAAAKRRISLAQKKRWAKQRAAKG
jgi:hypothetical protein